MKSSIKISHIQHNLDELTIVEVKENTNLSGSFTTSMPLVSKDKLKPQSVGLNINLLIQFLRKIIAKGIIVGSEIQVNI